MRGEGKGKVRTTPYWQVQTTPSVTQGAVGEVCNRSGVKCYLRDTPLLLAHVKESIGSGRESPSFCPLHQLWPSTEIAPNQGNPPPDVRPSGSVQRIIKHLCTTIYTCLSSIF